MANVFTTNASLPKPIDESQIFQDLENLQTAHNNAMEIIEARLTGTRTAAQVGVNASIVNTGGKPLVLLQHLSAGSIASIAGALIGQPFTLIAQSTGSFGMLDTGAFKLSANWTPSTDDALTLIWDGTNFNEIARSAN